jgi:hypothetical protein
MATKKQRLYTRGFAAFLMLASLLLPAQQTQAFVQTHIQTHVQERPATQWGNIYAGVATTQKQKPREKVAYLERKSKFVIKYNNFPDWAKIQFQAAADVWAANFQSSVPINVDATWSKSSSFSILGSARPGSYYSGFVGAPDPSLWYPSALANALAGRDLSGNSPEMIIQVNSLADWFKGTTGVPTNSEYDLQSVFLHEMAHGLGFLSASAYDSIFGFGNIDEPTPFDAYAKTQDGRRLADLDSPSIELGDALTSKLVWSGPLGTAANGGEPPLLYTPSSFEEGSSVAHLDESTFSSMGKDSVMTPNLDAGEIFHEPGPLLLAMMEDMRNKPPAGIAVGLPQAVRNAQALISDASAIIEWDLPTNSRAAQISSYLVKNVKTGAEKSVTGSPVTMVGLKNDATYSFSITAFNSLGSSPPVITNLVTPRAGWSLKVIDSNAKISALESASFNGEPALVYTDQSTGFLKLALWNGKIWNKIIVDGRGGSSGRTRNQIAPSISVCVGGSGKNQSLHIFYADAVDLDLRYALYKEKKFSYEIVDGNGAAINKYQDSIRVRTASDVSIANTCVANLSGVQVFYRDESQGVLLGATKAAYTQKWNYELIDGDRLTDGRSTGDVGFHLDSLFDGKKTYLIYDSVLDLNARNEVVRGEIRLASRSTLDPSAWAYQTLDNSNKNNAVAGFDVTLKRSYKGNLATWMSSSVEKIPKAQALRWTYLSSNPTISSVFPTGFGLPSQYLSSNGLSTAFNCQNRLCAVDFATRKVSLVSDDQNPMGISSDWILLNKKRYLAAGINGQLVLLRP